MRDPERISPFLEELEELWRRYPDYRIGQLVMNLCRAEGGGFYDPWEWEEDKWLELIRAYSDA